MRAAWQCETTWSLRACWGVSKPLALASGQTAPKNWRVLQHHFITKSQCKGWYCVGIYWRQGQAALSCHCHRRYLMQCTVRNLKPRLVKTCQRYNTAYSNPCDRHTCSSFLERQWELIQTRVMGLSPVIWFVFRRRPEDGWVCPPSVLPVGRHYSAAHCLCVMGQEDKSSQLSGFANTLRKMIALGAYFWHHINKKWRKKRKEIILLKKLSALRAL